MNTRLLVLLALLAVPVVALAQSASLYVVQPGDTLYRISRTHNVSVDAIRALNNIEGTTIEVGQTLRLTDRVPLPVRAPRDAERPADASPPAGQPPTIGREPDRPPAADRQTERPAETGRPLAETAAPQPAAGGTSHVVAPGETLFRIALRYDMSVADLRRLNGITGDQIEVGQRLAVSAGGARPTAEPQGAGRPAASQPIALGPPREWSLTETTVPADQVHFVEPGETLYSIAAALGLSADDLARTNALSTAPLPPGTLLRLPRPVNPALAARDDVTMTQPDEAGLALVYPDVMRGRPTESGETYDPATFTLSHRDYPFGTVVLVTNPASGRSTFARVVDRGPISRAYLVELSAAAAEALELDPNAARRIELRRLP